MRVSYRQPDTCNITLSEKRNFLLPFMEIFLLPIIVGGMAGLTDNAVVASRGVGYKGSSLIINI